MDDKITAVLAAYDVLIAEQQRDRGDRLTGGRHLDQDPTLRDPLLRAVGPETGQFLNIIARSLPKPHILELGTSYGYSGIWLAEAARATGGSVTSMELHDYKSAFARDMAVKADLADYVDFKVGDAVALIGDLTTGIDLVLVDLWKDLYVPCLEAFYPKLNPGAIVVADNMIRPANDEVKRYAEAVRALPGMTSVMLPVGSGIEVSRYEPA